MNDKLIGCENTMAGFGLPGVTQIDKSVGVTPRTTNIYHVTYSPEAHQMVLFFWGCNLACRGCYRQKNIYSLMLKEYIGAANEEPGDITASPTKFLEFDEVIKLFEGREIKHVVMEGAEAALDPLYPEIARTLHEKFGTHNILLTNALQLPGDLSHTDSVEIALKSIDDDLHIAYTGKSNKKILENFKKLHASGMKLIVESVYIPGLVGIEETEQMAEFVAGVDRTIPYIVLPYIRTGCNPWRRPTPADMEKVAAAARKYLDNVFCVQGDEQPIYETIKLF
ncbi:MAG: radical SAM protein [Dehalogenimonas sp.]|uniref:Radical SAM protein n=1 Tax=Candidatus Dehalogenimonas loeffleri TaxID=3127115 RepID=A0ABZ2J8E1_9CHLR|nr:radical SAM protein [Dehalogenimonas sp.]